MARFQKLLVALAVIATAACSPALLNITVPRSGYSVHRDIPYGPEARQKLDIYVPNGLKAPAPVLLFFYGGNWQSGSKDEYLAFGQAFASQGFVVVIADYRLYPAVKFPAFLEDSAKAFRFTHDNAGLYSGDPARVLISGHSAGAYNAIMLVSDLHYLKDAGADISWVRGAIGIAGPYDFLPLRDPNLIDLFGGPDRADTQPIHFIDGKRPAILLATGSDDETVLPRNTANMTARLRGLNSSVEQKIYPGVGHVGILLSLAGLFRSRTSLRDDMAAFILAN